MTELIDNPPPLPEPDLYVHELLANKGGVFLGVKEKGICEQAHVEGETSKEVFAYFSSAQYLAGEAAAFARGVAAGRNAGLEEVHAAIEAADDGEQSAYRHCQEIARSLKQ